MITPQFGALESKRPLVQGDKVTYRVTPSGEDAETYKSLLDQDGQLKVSFNKAPTLLNGQPVDPQSEQGQLLGKLADKLVLSNAQATAAQTSKKADETSPPPATAELTKSTPAQPVKFRDALQETKNAFMDKFRTLGAGRKLLTVLALTLLSPIIVPAILVSGLALGTAIAGAWLAGLPMRGAQANKPASEPQHTSDTKEQPAKTDTDTASSTDSADQNTETTLQQTGAPAAVTEEGTAHPPEGQSQEGSSDSSSAENRPASENN